MQRLGLIIGGGVIVVAGLAAAVFLTGPATSVIAPVASLGPALPAPAFPPLPAPVSPRSEATTAAAAASAQAPAPLPVTASPPPANGADAATAAAPSFDVVRVRPDGGAVIAGRAEPGARITLRDGEKVLGEVSADTHGEWVLIPDRPLAEGARSLTLSARGADGRDRPSDRVVVVDVPKAPGVSSTPAQAKTATTHPDVVATQQPAVSDQAVAVAIPRDHLGSVTVLQAPPVAASEATPPSQTVAVESLDYDAKGRVALGGKGAPGTTVQVYLDNVLVGHAATDPAGHWSLTPERTFDPGRHTVRADQVATAGKVTARAELPVEIAAVPSQTPGNRSVVVQPGNSLWRIAVRSYASGLRYVDIYQANRRQIRNPDLIYPGQIFELPAAGR